jgi:hypothetical protein
LTGTSWNLCACEASLFGLLCAWREVQILCQQQQLNWKFFFLTNYNPLETHVTTHTTQYWQTLVLTVETRNNLRPASVRTYTFFTTGQPPRFCQSMEPVAKAEKNVGRADKLTQVSIFVADEWEPGVFVSLTPAVAGLLALLVPTGGVGTACARRRCRHRQSARAWMSQVRAPNDGSESLLSMLLALGARVPHFLIVWWQRSNMSQERWCSIWGRDDE